MSPLLKLRDKDRCDKWMTLDLRDDEDVQAFVVFPLFGKEHLAGTDCWCEPVVEEDGAIVHNQDH